MTDEIPTLSEALQGRYQVERKIGEGGMATVYLAKDLKHGREVALKLLKPEISAVLGAERFLAEIQTTAQLQHPHILPLFDSGEADGQLFYVMPYVEGDTLRERLEREQQLPVDEAVSIAADVADALQAAHDAGVIHRDIKPANILLRGGKPLLADFGIALAVSAAGQGRLTETGLSMGTPYYMSPEQASADRDPSAATDVYSLGCVLYEMITGEPPFPGKSAQAVLAKILMGDAAPVTQFRKAVPPNVEAAVMRSIEKVPADRFQTARDFERALKDPNFRYGVEGAVGGVVTASGRRWKAAALTLAATSALLLGGVISMSTRAAEAVVARYRIQPEFELWRNPNPFAIRFSMEVAPDGSALVYSDTPGGDLYLKEKDEAFGTLLAGTSGAFDPTFSPDGAWIAFFTAEHGLRKVPLRGGSAITLADSIPANFGTAVWLEDGTILYAGPNWRLDRVPEAGGEVEVLLSAEQAGGFVQNLAPLPEARGVLYESCNSSCTQTAIRVLDLETLEQHELVPDAVSAWYASTGHVIYARRDGGVFAAPFDLKTLELTGPGVPVLGEVRAVPQFAAMRLTPEGTLLYLRGENSGVSAEGFQVMWVDREGNEEPLDPDWRSSAASLALSPDGTRLAVTLVGGDGSSIWVKELPSGPETRLTPDRSTARRPVWTPDGALVLYQTVLDSGQVFAARRYDASQDESVFLAHDPQVQQIAWSLDGGFFVYRAGSVNQGGVADLYYRNIGADTTNYPYFGTTAYDELAPSVSPDGRWVAYVSDVSGIREVYVRPFPNAQAGQTKISEGGGWEPLWAHTGEELFYRDDQGRLMAARIDTDPAFRVVERDPLFQVTGTYRSSADERRYDVSLDDQRFLMIKMLAGAGQTEGQVDDIILVENWFLELERILAGGR